jgi:molybdopterin-containing oxidoreductase family membrane subunit
MGTLYSIELLLLFIKLTMILFDKHSSLDTFLTYATLIVAVTASLVLGSVFGTVIGREGYSGIDASLLTFISALSSGVAMILLTSKNEINDYYLYAARWMFGLLTIFVTIKWVYLARAHVLEEPQWLPIVSVLGVALAWLLVKTLPKISASLLLASVFSIELAFVIQGQNYVLGPKTTWFGISINYSPNIAEIGILVFGVSIAVIAYNVIVQGVPYLRSRNVHN